MKEPRVSSLGVTLEQWIEKDFTEEDKETREEEEEEGKAKETSSIR